MLLVVNSVELTRAVAHGLNNLSAVVFSSVIARHHKPVYDCSPSGDRPYPQLGYFPLLLIGHDMWVGRSR